jgi:hypothetical protein
MTPQTDLFKEVLDLTIAAGYDGREAIGPFLGLSAVLLGRPELEAWLGRAYLKTLAGFATSPKAETPNSPAYTASDIKNVLTRFAELKHRYGSDPVRLAAHVRDELLRSPDAGTGPGRWRRSGIAPGSSSSIPARGSCR